MRLRKDFYHRQVSIVAEELLGCILVRAGVRLKIVEVEAYGNESDSASHARFGITDRTRAMFGPPGCCYIYLCYGIHQMLNIVCEKSGCPAAVLIRAAEPLNGLSIIQARRRCTSMGKVLLGGPGKVAQALGLRGQDNLLKIYLPGDLELHGSVELKPRVVRGPRVGIDFADDVDRRRAWRFAVENSEYVTARHSLS